MDDIKLKQEVLRLLKKKFGFLQERPKGFGFYIKQIRKATIEDIVLKPIKFKLGQFIWYCDADIYYLTKYITQKKLLQFKGLKISDEIIKGDNLNSAFEKAVSKSIPKYRDFDDKYSVQFSNLFPAKDDRGFFHDMFMLCQKQGAGQVEKVYREEVYNVGFRVVEVTPTGDWEWGLTGEKDLDITSVSIKIRMPKGESGYLFIGVVKNEKLFINKNIFKVEEKDEPCEDSFFDEQGNGYVVYKKFLKGYVDARIRKQG